MINVLNIFRRRSLRDIGATVSIRLYQNLRIFIYRVFFSTGSPTLRNVKLSQPVQFVGKGKIEIAAVTIGVWPSPGFLSGTAYFEARSIEAIICIKEGTVFNNGATLIADKGLISIGKNCLIGSEVFITDSDFHGISVQNRRNNNYECIDVVIGNEVFIGNDVKILKGVRVGDNAVIGVGSIVVNDVPANAIYAGIPAKLIRYL
ncbi:acetyltransferase [Pseudomonas fluorescens]|nr:acetyltransferase [Pseudomonas fluorescens]